jgi:hypothetical protein
MNPGSIKGRCFFRELERRYEMKETSAAAEYAVRETILGMLSDEEVAKVSTGEATSVLGAGQEFIDLGNLGLGIQHVNAATTVKMANVLPRKAVSAETWPKLVDYLAARRREETVGK